ncbi:TPA: type II secretion system F family protein [Acinetobacter baumannii]|nr:type II secretion system F family protein [Acinetobacter baumannii]
MADFSVKYISKNNKMINEKLSFKDSRELKRTISLEKEGILIEYKEIKQVKIAKINYVIFAYEIRTLLKSGISIAEALSILKDNNANYSDMVSQLFDGLHDGQSFSNSMTVSDYAFPSLLIATIAASEKNGTLINALENYINYESNVNKIKSKVISASIYPIVLIIVSFFIVLFLLVYLVPKFSIIYQDVSVELPFLSKSLLTFGSVIYEYKMIFLISIIFLILSIGIYFYKVGIKNLALRLIQLNKFSAEICEKFLLSRFYRGFALLLESGSSVIEAFSLMEETLTMSHKLKIQQARSIILEGKSLSYSLISSKLTTPISSRLLSAGDKNGEIINMLKQSSEFYDMEIENFIERASQVIEPILMIIIGFFIGGIIVLLYMPIFDLANSVQQ